MSIGRKTKSSAQICCFLLAIFLLLAGCDSRPTDYPRTNSSALENPRQTTLGKAFADMEEKHPEKSGYRLLSDGVDAFVARLALMQAAEKTIDGTPHKQGRRLTPRL